MQNVCKSHLAAPGRAVSSLMRLRSAFLEVVYNLAAFLSCFQRPYALGGQCQCGTWLGFWGVKLVMFLPAVRTPLPPSSLSPLLTGDNFYVIIFGFYCWVAPLGEEMPCEQRGTRNKPTSVLPLSLGTGETPAGVAELPRKLTALASELST